MFNLKRWKKMLILGVEKFSDPYYQGFAAQMAFYFFVSLVPIIILVSQIAGIIFNQEIEKAIVFIEEMGGEFITPQILDLISYKTAGAMNVFFFILALFASSRAQFAMSRISNYTLSDGETTGKSYWIERGRAVLNMLLTMVTIIFALIILVYGEQILHMILSLFGLEKDSGNIWLWMRWPIMMVLFWFMICYNYYVSPSVKFPFRSIIPGSIFSTFGLLLVTMFYSKYVLNVAKYDILYGSLASIVALMLWFYLMAWVLYLGVLMNKVWNDTDVEDNENIENIDMKKIIKEILFGAFGGVDRK
ncbi:MAG: YihY/virulence factor BrkB family protein [Anaerovoracaceae bacterium]